MLLLYVIMLLTTIPKDPGLPDVKVVPSSSMCRNQCSPHEACWRRCMSGTPLTSLELSAPPTRPPASSTVLPFFFCLVLGGSLAAVYFYVVGEGLPAFYLVQVTKDSLPQPATPTRSKEQYLAEKAMVIEETKTCTSMREGLTKTNHRNLINSAKYLFAPLAHGIFVRLYAKDVVSKMGKKGSYFLIIFTLTLALLELFVILIIRCVIQDNYKRATLQEAAANNKVRLLQSKSLCLKGNLMDYVLEGDERGREGDWIECNNRYLESLVISKGERLFFNILRDMQFFIVCILVIFFARDIYN